MKLEQGDIIVNDDGSRRKILGVCGKAHYVSKIHKYNIGWEIISMIKRLLSVIESFVFLVLGRANKNMFGQHGMKAN